MLSWWEVSEMAVYITSISLYSEISNISILVKLVKSRTSIYYQNATESAFFLSLFLQPYAARNLCGC
jgi:hypothetical protein